MNSTTSSQSVSHLGKHRSSKPTTINRRLGATENIYYFLDQLYCLNFIIFVEIAGSLQIDQINKPMKALQAEQPLLRACFALIDGHYWFKPAPQLTSRSRRRRVRSWVGAIRWLPSWTRRLW